MPPVVAGLNTYESVAVYVKWSTEEVIYLRDIFGG